MRTEDTDITPWYKQFWPWFVFSIPAISVVAGISLLIIALKNPVYLVVDEEEYDQIRSELRANPSAYADPGPEIEESTDQDKPE